MNNQNKQGGILNAYLLVFLGIAIIALVTTGYFFYGIQPVDATSNESVSFEIESGESFQDISARLSNERLIRSISAFKFYSFISGSAHNLKPGSYDLARSMSAPNVIERLTLGSLPDRQVTFPEGVTIKDMDIILDRAGIERDGNLYNYDIDNIRDDYSFLAQALSLEGFLFPDTYRFNIETTSEDIIRRMLDNFEEKVWSSVGNGSDWYDILILASYLEREVPDLEDMRIVAGILLKRLEIGMLLQVDATISYATCDGQYLECERLQITRDDIEMASPYNTYLRMGWTPTPISNPGMNAIEAAMSPIQTPYWYYLSSRSTGETIFSETLDEHNTNRAIHL